MANAISNNIHPESRQSKNVYGRWSSDTMTMTQITKKNKNKTNVNNVHEHATRNTHTRNSTHYSLGQTTLQEWHTRTEVSQPIYPVGYFLAA